VTNLPGLWRFSAQGRERTGYGTIFGEFVALRRNARVSGGSDEILTYVAQPMLNTSNAVAIGTPNRVPAWRAPLSKNSSGSKNSHPSPSM
jgi:hypothetical protein